MWFKMSRVRAPSLTPFVTLVRTGASIDHKTVRVRDFLCVEASLPTHTSSEMLAYLSYIQRYAMAQPRIYWVNIPFYTIISQAKQKFLFGFRPEDLAHIDTIEQKAWNKHEVHLNRLEQFPLEKAEYYVRIKELHGINSVRGLSKVTGEDWSYIAKILRTLALPEQVKDFFQSNKNNPAILKFFHLRRIIDIVQQREERLQLARFRGLLEEFEASSYEESRGLNKEIF